MPQIIPIKDLKNTSDISDLCHTSQEPIFITKNGYGDMVIMSMETYENTVWNPAFTAVWKFPKSKYIQEGLRTQGIPGWAEG